MDGTENQDGIHNLVARENMSESARKLRDTYAITPGAPFLKCEFPVYYSLDAWYQQGLSSDADLNEIFHLDPPGHHELGQIGWCETAFEPLFEVKILEDRGEHEVEQDAAGRHVLYFKGRRDGFMPEYIDHPVKDRKTWEENVKWRMNPNSKERYISLDSRMRIAREEAGQGKMMVQNLIGGYMYLRSLIGPAELLYMFCESPDLIHDCMKTWFNLADTLISLHQEHVTLDEIYFGEDICFKQGPLISPDMMREFLLPYYQQLIDNAKSRQIDRSRHLYVQVDTDGHLEPVIPVYQEVGLDVMSPFEVASDCDVVELGQKYPRLVIIGGIDKRILATSKSAIDKHLEYILPAMRARGGYIPTCDHGVPAEVPLENYLHYRKRCIELGG